MWPTEQFEFETPGLDAELARPAHKLDVKLQSLCESGFSLFALRMLA